MSEIQGSWHLSSYTNTLRGKIVIGSILFVLVGLLIVAVTLSIISYVSVSQPPAIENLGAPLYIGAITNATNSTAGGALTVAGGAAIGKDFYVGANETVYGNLSVTGNETVGGTLTMQAPFVLAPTGSSNSYTVTPATPAAARALGLPDPGNAANIMLTSMKGNNPNVTQTTSNSTAVTTTATTGIVTMYGTFTGLSASFAMNNPNILATSNVIAWTNCINSVTYQPLFVNVSSTGLVAGQCQIQVVNPGTPNATIAAPLIYYLII